MTKDGGSTYNFAARVNPLSPVSTSRVVSNPAVAGFQAEGLTALSPGQGPEGRRPGTGGGVSWQAEGLRTGWQAFSLRGG